MNSRQQLAIYTVSKLCKQNKRFSVEEFKDAIREGFNALTHWHLETVKGDFQWLLDNLVFHKVISETEEEGVYACLIEL